MHSTFDERLNRFDESLEPRTRLEELTPHARHNWQLQ